MEMEDTRSVEKLELKLLGVISFDSEELRKKYKDAIKQAKEMEFEQRKKDFVNGYKARAKASKLIFDETSEMYAIKLFNASGPSIP